jgi:hypothetical protein
MKILTVLIILFISQSAFSEVSKDEYFKITKSLYFLYGKKFEDNGGKLNFTLKESDQAANAFASKNVDNVWEITVISSLLNFKEQTRATIGLILCHEIGHFMGGQPYVEGIQLTPAVRSSAPKKMSCEGQADYFATSECIKKLSNEMPDLFTDNLGVLNPLVSAECDKSYSEKKESELCQNVATASFQTTLIYQKIMEKLNVYQSFYSRIENEKSDRTLNHVGEYPTLDCRYETFINGILCSSLTNNNCDDKKWSRPACWFQE